MDDLSAGVVDFISRRINSVEQIAVLLLLRGDPNRSWTIPDISAELRSAPRAIEQRLRDLYDAGVLVASSTGTAQFAPTSPEVAAVIDELADAYETRPNRIIELIYSRSKSLQDFADAFKLKKEKP